MGEQREAGAADPNAMVRQIQDAMKGAAGASPSQSTPSPLFNR
jgi:hypothetical protein